MNPSARPLDTGHLFERTATLPEQLLAAVERAAILELGLGPAVPDNVVVLATGSAAIAGEALRALCEPELAVPVSVIEGYELPAFVGPGTLAFALSYSGESPETIEAVRTALTRGARLVTVSAGGELGRLARDHDLPFEVLPSDLGLARQTVGPMIASLLVYCSRLGLSASPDGAIRAAVAQLTRRRAGLVDGTFAGELARRIDRSFPLLHGAAGIGAVAARRWKSQVNLNAKCPAFFSVQPGLSYDEIAGFGQAGDVTRQLLTLVRLRTDFDDARVVELARRDEPLLREVVADVIDVEAAGSGRLTQLLDLFLLGDFVSLELAVRAGVDPGPAPALETSSAE